MHTSDGVASSANISTQGHTIPLEISEIENSWKILVLSKEKVEELRRRFEEFEPPDGATFEDVMEAMMEKDTVVLELPSAGIAIATNVNPRHTADVVFYMFDKQLKGRAPLFRLFIRDLFKQFKLQRVTMSFPTFAPMEKLAVRMGFTKEGELRNAGPRGEGICIYGILDSEIREDYARQGFGDSSGARGDIPS